METKLSIIIVNWNTAKLLSQCLNSLKSDPPAGGRNPKSEIIVVDNGSTDGSVDMVKKFIKDNSDKFGNNSENSGKISLIENQTNLGFAKGNNIGIKQAKGEYIMLLNSDTIVKDGAIGNLVGFLDNHSDVDIVGPKLLNEDGTSQANCGRFPSLWVSFIMLFKEHFGGSDYVRNSPKVSGFVDWLMGAAFVARKKVFEKAGGLDERIFMYMEEVEWFYRAKEKGFSAYFYKDAEIIHLGRGSSKSGKKEPIINIYKGLLHFYKIHKNPLEVFLLVLMLKFKALSSYLVGILKNDKYLIETYGQAFKIS